MLGEDHSLLNDFPAYADEINELYQNNPEFTQEAKKYHTLDSQIRKLELNNSPISDKELHTLKHDRALLKDKLYRQLL